MKNAFITVAEVMWKSTGALAGKATWLTVAILLVRIDEEPLPVERHRIDADRLDLGIERPVRDRARAWSSR